MQKKINRADTSGARTYDSRTPRTKTPEQALQSLMNLCAKAEKSSGDALRLMVRWGVEPAARAGVLEKLVKARFIDDARYASAFVREKTSLAGWGVYKIRTGLAAKGIAREIIGQATAQIIPEASGGKLAELLARKMRTVKASSAYDLRGKLMRYGLARGFGYEEVTDSVEKLVKTQE